MSRVLIYSGTTEGRVLSEILADAGIECDVSVATEYGVAVMKDSEKVHVLEGRLDVPAMKQLYNDNAYEAVVDATHPYALEVTKNIKESLSAYKIPYLRLVRDTTVNSSNGCNYYTSINECAKALKNTTGNILLTTGSKELSSFCRSKAMIPRIYARVLPSVESIETCNRNGLSGKQIIAMQGPFSEESNAAMIKQYDIAHLVLKESGKIGGEDEKLVAAQKAGILCHIIERPKTDDALSTKEVLDELSKILGKTIKGIKICVTLAGLGCGSPLQMTEEVKYAIKEANYIFGAERMIENINTSAEKYPYYRKDEILPILEKINSENAYSKKVVVLFSGDTGFYSGAANLSDALLELGYVDVNILPGISSVSCLASKVGTSYSESNIVTTHGVREEKWLPEIIHSSRYNKKTFFITSGPDDINSIGKALLSLDLQPGDISIILGYQLSYPDEDIRRLTPRDCLNIGKSGLYTGLILNPAPLREVITPSLKDSDFTRGDVPMTKEEIRQLSICRLNLTRSAVLYDIGSGTGSIAVSIAKLSPGIDVYAIDNNKNAAELIDTNAREMGTFNVTVINDTAPECLSNLPMATHAFIGGSRGRLKEILDNLYSINPYMRVVINAISLESVGEITTLLNEYSVTNMDMINVMVNRINRVGDYHMPSPMNPIYICSFDFTERQGEDLNPSYKDDK